MKKDKSPISAAELLRRWISGTARLADERRLDETAGDDPFLNEALQGYRRHAAEDHEAALQRLRHRYRQQDRRSPTLLYLRRFAAIAAAVALAVVVWQVLDRQAPTAPATLSESRQSPDTPPPSPGLAATTTAPTEMNAPAQPATTEQPAKTKPGANPPIIKISPETGQSDEISAEPAGNLAMADDAAVSTEAAPTPAVSSPSAEIAVQEEESVAETKAFESAKTAIDSDKKAAPTVGDFLPKSNRAAAAKKDKIPVATPEGGFDAMKKFVRKNLRYPEQARLNGISGEVVLEFLVLDDGSLDQIKVVKGLPYGCNDEAIRLLKAGPKWRSYDGPTWASYTFQFKN